MGQKLLTRLNDGSIDSQMLIGLIDMGIKGLLLMATAGLAAAAMRKHAAAARHLVWLLALCGLLLLPIVSLLMPKWPLPILPAIEAPNSGPVTTSLSSTPSIQPTATNAQPLAPDTPTPQPVEIIPAADSQSMPTTPVTAPPARPASEPVNIPMWILAIWNIAALLSIAPFVAGLIAVLRLRRHADSFAEADIQTLATALGQSIGLRRPARLLRGPEGTMPMATGFFAPAVFLPADALSWTEEKRRVVLLHELAHVKRRDCLTHAIARVAVALHWFNPLAWLALRQLRIEREHACDDLVLAAGERPSAYAENLLEIARTLRASTVVSAAAITMAQKSQLEGRLLAVLDAGRTRGSVTATFLSTTLIASTIILALLSTLGVARQTPHEIVFGSGVRATVVGVATVHEADSTTWNANGAHLSQIPEGYPSRLDNIDDSLRRAVFVEVNIPDDVSNPEDVSVKARSNAHWEATELIDSIPRRIKFSANVSHATKTPDDDVRKRRLTAKCSMPDDATTFDLEVGIASGAWKAVTADIAPGSGSYESPDDFIHEVMTSQPYERDGKAAFSVTYSRQPKSPADTSSKAALGDSPPSLHDLDWRIVVWNTDGVEFLARSSGGTTSNNLAQWESVVEDLKPDDIARIDLQVRDYEWQKFEGIAVNPDNTGSLLDRTQPRSAATTPSESTNPPDSTVESAFQIDFSAGLIASLVAVGDSHGANLHTFWQPDGTPIGAEPVEFESILSVLHPSEGEVEREFLLRIVPQPGGPAATDISARWRIVTPSSSSSGGQNVQDNVRYIKAAMSISQSLTSADLELGIAAGPWTTAVEAGFAMSSTIGEYGLAVDRPYVQEGELTITVSHNVPFEKDCRLVAFDQTGVAHPLVSRGTYSADQFTQATYSLESLSPENIQRIELQVRDFEWRKFESIALKPDTESEPKKTEAQNLIKSLSDEQFERVDESFSAQFPVASPYSLTRNAGRVEARSEDRRVVLVKTAQSLLRVDAPTIQIEDRTNDGIRIHVDGSATDRPSVGVLMGSDGLNHQRLELIHGIAAQRPAINTHYIVQRGWDKALVAIPTPILVPEAMTLTDEWRNWQQVKDGRKLEYVDPLGRKYVLHGLGWRRTASSSSLSFPA